MAQIKRERLPNRFCPKCGAPMLYWGSIKKENMVICIVKECNNLMPFEQSLRYCDTKEGQKEYKAGYGNGYEDGFEVAKCQGSEIEEGFLEEVEE